jgi:mono/diheme cytochrome c family protein
MGITRISLLALSGALLLAGCRGKPFEQPPIHINPNMDYQPKYQPQEANIFFADNKANRLPVEGTVARGALATDKAYFSGKDASGNLISKSPVALTKDLMVRGQERYTIYCQPCHGGTGDGKGIVIGYGYVQPPSFHEARLVTSPDGHFYDVINNGIRSMPAYRHQVPVEDRWAIVAYIRALQKSQNATKGDLDKLGLTVNETDAK